MKMWWRKIIKLCKLTPCSIVVCLFIFNILMGLYTIPLLINGSSEVHDKDYSQQLTPLETKFLKRELKVPDSWNTLENGGSLGDQQNVEDYSHDYFYIHQPTTGCAEDSPFLLLVVCSAVQNFEQRQAIRETWASVIHNHRLSTKIVFMLGAPTLEYNHVQSHITKESQDNGDVIQEDFIDSYLNLTIKSIGVLKWALNFCPGVKYLMKADDDTFINVANLVTTLMDVATQHSHQPPFLMGHVIENAKPISDRYSKWFVPTTLFRDNTYPKYLSGSAYVINGDTIENLYFAATSQKPFWLEDVYITGVLSSQLNISLLHNAKFTYKKQKLSNPCFYKTVVSAHGLSASDLSALWRDMLADSVGCSGHFSIEQL